MGSRRLPGKVLEEIGGQPALTHVVARTRAARSVDEVVVATSDLVTDQLIVEHAERIGVRCIQGPEADVLARYLAAASFADAQVVVRITADCPLIAPRVIDEVVAARAATGADYASNTLDRGFPRGLDVECFTRGSLESAAARAAAPDEREHVTPYLYRHPERFLLSSVRSGQDQATVRWTLDTPADLNFLRMFVAEFPAALIPTSDWREVADTSRWSEKLRAAHDAAIRSAEDSIPAPVLR